MSANQANQLYRIAQEALTNVARHAQAGRVRVDGEAVEGEYRLAVEDEQPAGVALRQRLLRDQLRRQGVVEGIGLHAPIVAQAGRSGTQRAQRRRRGRAKKKGL